MKGPMLSARWAPVLREFARADTLLAFDFDGLLAPIVADRTRARVPAEISAHPHGGDGHDDLRQRRGDGNERAADERLSEACLLG